MVPILASLAITPSLPTCVTEWRRNAAILRTKRHSCMKNWTNIAQRRSRNAHTPSNARSMCISTSPVRRPMNRGSIPRMLSVTDTRAGSCPLVLDSHGAGSAEVAGPYCCFLGYSRLWFVCKICFSSAFKCDTLHNVEIITFNCTKKSNRSHAEWQAS